MAMGIQEHAILAVGLSPAIQKTILFDQFIPGEVNRSLRYYTDAAGKCINVGRVLVQGSADAAVLTVVGEENQQEFETLCSRDGIPLYPVISPGRVRTCTTIVDHARKECTELVVNEAESISEKVEAAFQDKFLEILPCISHGVIISGSRLPGFSNRIIPFLVEQAKQAGLKVYADFKGEDLKNAFQSEVLRPDYVKINDGEFLETFSGDDLKAGLRKQAAHFGSNFVISRGPSSTLAADIGGIIEIPSKKIEALNPIGCGDSMTAGIAQGILEGKALEEAVIKGRDYAAANAGSIHPGWILP